MIEYAESSSGLEPTHARIYQFCDQLNLQIILGSPPTLDWFINSLSLIEISKTHLFVLF